MKELDRAEKAVFEAIAKQSKKYPDRPFKYSVDEGQLFFNGLKVAIDRSEHIEIIHRLANSGVIDADWLIPLEETPDDGYIMCEFARHRSWAEEKFTIESVAASVENYSDDIFINIHPSEIKSIRDTYAMTCTANISLSSDPLALRIRCEDNNGEYEDFNIHTFKDGGRPYEIVSYALKHPGEKIFLEELRQNIKSNKKPIGPKANIAKFFERNSTIRVVLSPLIELGAKSICIKQNVKLTKSQYEAIKTRAS